MTDYWNVPYEQILEKVFGIIPILFACSIISIVQDPKGCDSATIGREQFYFVEQQLSRYLVRI